jgi:hypothetical protein
MVLKTSPQNRWPNSRQSVPSKLIPQSSAGNASRPVATMQDVFAVGDVSALEARQLLATAQVANQEAK